MDVISGQPGAEPVSDAAVANAADAGDDQRPPTSWTRTLVEWGIVLGLALLLVVGLRAFVIQTYFIPSGSMETTLNIGDRIVVDKLSYHLRSVHRGDIVVFARPPGETDKTLTDLVKRVIGLPGETISSDAVGHVLINGHVLDEPWLPPIGRGQLAKPITTQVIPAGEYFVMGDNRNESMDSRYFGSISGHLIVGCVVVRIWPASALHLF